MASDRNSSTVDDDHSNSSDDMSVDDMPHEQFLCTSSNVVISENNGTSSAKPVDNVTKSSETPESIDSKSVVKEKEQKSLKMKGSYETRKDVPNPKQHDKQILTDDGRSVKFEQYVKSTCDKEKLRHNLVDTQTKWAIECGKECLILCEKMVGKESKDKETMSVGHFHNFQMRMTQAKSQANVIEALCEYACIIGIVGTNEKNSCLAMQYLQKCLNTILSALSDGESHCDHSRTMETLNSEEHPIGRAHSMSHISTDMEVNGDKNGHVKGPAEVSKVPVAKIKGVNHCSHLNTKIDKSIKIMVDKSINEGVFKHTGKADDGFTRTISYLKQRLPVSVAENIIIMPAIDNEDYDQEDTDQGGQPATQYDQATNQGGQIRDEGNQTASQNNQGVNQGQVVNQGNKTTNSEEQVPEEEAQAARQNNPTTNQGKSGSQNEAIIKGNQTGSPGDQAANQAGNAIGSGSLASNMFIESTDESMHQNNNEQPLSSSASVYPFGALLLEPHVHWAEADLGVVPTTSTEDVSPHTSSYHDSTAQQYNSCTNPGELEKEMREAILSVKRQTSPAHFHVPMDMLEQSHTPINSHLPALFPLGPNVSLVQTSDAQYDVNQGLGSIYQADEVSREEEFL